MCARGTCLPSPLDPPRTSLIVSLASYEEAYKMIPGEPGRATLSNSEYTGADEIFLIRAHRVDDRVSYPMCVSVHWKPGDGRRHRAVFGELANSVCERYRLK